MTPADVLLVITIVCLVGSAISNWQTIRDLKRLERRFDELGRDRGDN